MYIYINITYVSVKHSFRIIKCLTNLIIVTIDQYIYEIKVQ